MQIRSALEIFLFFLPDGQQSPGCLDALFLCGLGHVQDHFEFPDLAKGPVKTIVRGTIATPGRESVDWMPVRVIRIIQGLVADCLRKSRVHYALRGPYVPQITRDPHVAGYDVNFLVRAVNPAPGIECLDDPLCQQWRHDDSAYDSDCCLSLVQGNPRIIQLSR